MSRKDMIEKALLLNNVKEVESVVIKIDTTATFSIHLRLLVLLLFNFAMQQQMTDDEIYDFIMNNLNEVLDIITTELELTLFTFNNLCEEELTDIVELHNKDECCLLLALAIQEKVNKKLKEII